MDKLYFLVSWGKQNKAAQALHDYFFNDQGAFTYGILIALGIALIAAIVYYFVLGRNVTTAKMQNWWICGIVALAATFCISDFVIIGSNKVGAKKETITYKYSFNKALNEAPTSKEFNSKHREFKTSVRKADLRQAKDKIQKELKKGGDVRYPYSLNTTIWCAIFYFALSMLLKGFSEAAKTKPLKWPY